MRRFLVKRARTENTNDVQPEVELEQRTENVNDAQPEIGVEQPAPSVANEFNPNAIERDPGKRKQICEYPPNIQDQYISLIVTTTTTSCKRRDALIEAQHQDILDRLDSGEISTGRGLHQSSTLPRPGDTRW
ncbi:hypothetical protein ZWY2020_037595, partial [Hordeum vulgare]